MPRPGREIYRRLLTPKSWPFHSIGLWTRQRHKICSDIDLASERNCCYQHSSTVVTPHVLSAVENKVRPSKSVYNTHCRLRWQQLRTSFVDNSCGLTPSRMIRGEPAFYRSGDTLVLMGSCDYSSVSRVSQKSYRYSWKIWKGWVMELMGQ